MARLAPVLLALILTATVGAAMAQTLQRLTVRSMTLSAQPDRVHVGQTLRLVLRVVVAQPIARLDNVVLGDLSGFQVLGDERRCGRVRNRSDCIETLTVQATAVGVHTIEPPTLDAIDAQTGRPTRFAANGVRVTVTGAPLATPRPEVDALRLLAVAMLALAGIVAWLLAALFLAPKRRAKRAPATRAAPSAAPAVEGTDSRWRVALAELRAHPTRAHVLRMRTLLRDRIAARPSETFGDLKRRNAHLEQPSAMEALRLLEAAAFVDDSRLPRAVADALCALEAVPATASRP